ncbi:MAG: hypothetical protein ACE5JP_17325 [Candidatus Bipolaricaulia bacterium]
MADIILLSNGPGEITRWVRPVVKRIHRELPDADLILFIPPCQFATGKEKAVASQMTDLDRVFSPMEYWKFLLLGNAKRWSRDGVILRLGGDLIHPILLSRRFKYPRYAYTEDDFEWSNRYRKFLVPDEQAADLGREKAAPEKIEVVGNLMVDGVEIAASNVQRPMSKVNSKVLFLPGSRRFQVSYMVPFFLEAAERLLSGSKGMEISLLVSEFISRDELEEALRDSARGSSISGDLNGDRVVLASGREVRLILGDKIGAMKETDLAVTIPGTNTAELAILGTPMLVLFPLNKPEEIPLKGMGWFADLVPVAGKWIKRKVINKGVQNLEFIALPNIKANRRIVPELVGILTPDQVAAKVETLLDDRKGMEQQRKDLGGIMGSGGAAGRIVDIIKGGI